ncbi:MAG: aldose epimerase family protein [Bacteroidota bacterium]
MITRKKITTSLERFCLKNTTGYEAHILNLGATLTSFLMPDKEGKMENVVLGLPNAEDYLSDHPFLGSTIGRFANRIRDGKFQLNGQSFEVDQNLGKHHLHGGKTGFHTRIWEGEIKGEKLVLTYHSPAGESGYPASLTARVSYELTDNCELIIMLSAEGDADTHVNMTNHAYFNLCGDMKRDVKDHILQIHASQVTAVDSDLVPTGEYTSIEGTPLDFLQPKRVGQDIAEDHELIKLAGGYDHNYALDRKMEGLLHAATLWEPESGRKLRTYTTQPGIQLFTSNGMEDAFPESSGRNMISNGGICLEPQHFPDSPNIPHFPSTLLKEGERYEETIMFKFGIEK